MDFLEFKEFMEKEASGYEVFMKKALDYQKEKNKTRSAKKRWNEVIEFFNDGIAEMEFE